MRYVERLGVTQGSGRLARRKNAVLYVPEAESADLVERFIQAEQDMFGDALAAHVLDDPDAATSFVMIEWPHTPGETPIRVIVRGDVDVTSDLDAMPSLSGADSETWMTHEVIHRAGSARFRCGASADAGTDLRAGLVAAGGFELELTLPARTRPPADEGQLPSADRDRRLDRIASLEAAGGGDWMEDSLQLGDASPITRRDPPVHTEDMSPEADPGPQPDASSALAAHLDVELPDGTRHNIDGPLVLGRQPVGSHARSPDAIVIRLDTAATVSRTHLLLHLDGQRLLATDCSSSGGTVLVPNGDLTSIHLDPWIPHEVGNGDRICLGGAETTLAIRSS